MADAAGVEMANHTEPAGEANGSADFFQTHSPLTETGPTSPATASAGNQRRSSSIPAGNHIAIVVIGFIRLWLASVIGLFVGLGATPITDGGSITATGAALAPDMVGTIAGDVKIHAGYCGLGAAAAVSPLHSAEWVSAIKQIGQRELRFWFGPSRFTFDSANRFFDSDL